MQKIISITIAILFFTSLLTWPISTAYAQELRDAETESSEERGKIQQKTEKEIKAIEAEKIKYSGRFDLNALRVNTKTKDGQGVTQGSSFIERAKNQNISPITAIILEVTEFLTKVVGSLAFLMLILSGLWMIVSLGNEQQVTRGKSIFTWALLGIALALGAYFIVTFIQGLLIE